MSDVVFKYSVGQKCLSDKHGEIEICNRWHGEDGNYYDVVFTKDGHAWTFSEAELFYDMSDILNFYQNKRPNKAGMYLNDFYSYTFGQLEMGHDYVQWVFPTNEPSSMNCDAPVLTKDEATIIKDSCEMRHRLKYAFEKMIFFLGFRCVLGLLPEGSLDDPTKEVPPLPPPTVVPDARPDARLWLTHFNHNFLRVTRIIKSLRLCGLPEYALAFYNALKVYEATVSKNSFQYWTKAAFGPLWENE